MTINGLFSDGNWGLTICSIETYRGHTKGFHFYFNHALAIGLIVARTLERKPKNFLILPPGLALYLFYCGVSSLSVVSAPVPLYALMATHKMVFAALIFLAAYHFIRSSRDLEFFAQVMAVTMLWEALIVLKMKYVNGVYQAHGTFEHQNSLVMYASLIGMVFLSLGLGPRSRVSNLCLVAFGACGLIVMCTLSRAGMFMFATGSAGLAFLSILEKPTARRFVSIASLGVVGMFGLLLGLDSIISRFHDRGNQASQEYREVLNEASRQMVRDHPLGIGWNNFALAINSPYPYAEFVFDWLRGKGHRIDEDRKNSTVESHYYLLLAENGYAGFWIYLLLITLFLYWNLRATIFFEHGAVRLISLGIGVGCCLNYAQSTVERVLTQPRNLMLWLILLAITARIEHWRRNSRKRISHPFKKI